MNDPGLRSCGWFWDDHHRHSWVWWHGSAPHAPYPFPHVNLQNNEDPGQQEGIDLMGAPGHLMDDDEGNEDPGQWEHLIS